MRFIFRFTTVLLSVFILFSASSLAGETKGKLQGKWVGPEVGADAGEWTFAFADSILTATGPNPGEYYKGRITYIDDEKFNKIEVTFTDASEPAAVGMMTTVIYKIEKNKMTFVAGDPEYGTVPASFEKKWDVRFFKLEKVVKKKKAKKKK